MPAKTNGVVTRRDVAMAAGVSLTTVTHALNPPSGVRMAKPTRARVCRIARKLGYRPCFVGRALVTRRSYTVGLLQPRRESVHYALYRDILLGMVEVMEPDDYHLMILFRDSPGYLKVIRQGRLDGVFVLQSDRESAHVRQAAETGLPVVVVNSSVEGPAGLPVGRVDADHAGMMRQAVDELLGLGCRRLLCLVDERYIDANRQMYEGFLGACAGLRLKGVIGETLWPGKSGLAGILAGAFAAGRGWDGVVTDGVEPAETVVEAAGRAGLRMGHDIQLISTDVSDGQTTRSRLEHSAYTEQPALMGREAWRILRGLMLHEPVERRVLVPYKRVLVNGQKIQQP